MWRSLSLRRVALPAGAAGVSSALCLHSTRFAGCEPSEASAAVSDATPPSDRSVDLFDAVGNTPLLEIKSLSKLTGCRILAKAEFMNPSGSIKDRAAKYLILDAEAKGQLQQPGDVIVEATGGNTGVSLALLGAARGYKTIFTMTDKVAIEKREMMKILGAEVVLAPPVPWLDRDNFYHVAHKMAADLAKDGKRAICPDQFENLANMRAHYETTGPEIWRQAQGKVDGFVASAGTAGTLAGTSKFLKEQNPNLVAWLVDPEGCAGMSLFINNDSSTSKVEEGYEMVPLRPGDSIAEGIAHPRVTPNYREGPADRGVVGTDQEIVDMAYFLLRNDGIFVGPSAALNVIGAVKMARELGPGHTVVTVLCDGGDRYRSKLFNREWLEQRGLAPRDEGNRSSLAFVGDAAFPTQ